MYIKMRTVRNRLDADVTSVQHKKDHAISLNLTAQIDKKKLQLRTMYTHLHACCNSWRTYASFFAPCSVRFNVHYYNITIEIKTVTITGFHVLRFHRFGVFFMQAQTATVSVAEPAGVVRHVETVFFVCTVCV